MIFEIIMLAVTVCLSLLCAYLVVRYRKVLTMLSNLAAEFVKLDTKVDTVDRTTGADVYRLRKEFEAFKTDYGEAAIDEMRQNAKREKAWADGVNNIMSFGARFQDQR